jgi:hypothetical protein
MPTVAYCTSWQCLQWHTAHLNSTQKGNVCLSIATTVNEKRHNVTLFVYCLSFCAIFRLADTGWDKTWTTEIACSAVLQITEQSKRPWVRPLLIPSEMKLGKRSKLLSLHRKEGRLHWQTAGKHIELKQHFCKLRHSILTTSRSWRISKPHDTV